MQWHWCFFLSDTFFGSVSVDTQRMSILLCILFQMVQELAALQEELQEEKFLLQETDEVMLH